MKSRILLSAGALALFFVSASAHAQTTNLFDLAKNGTPKAMKSAIAKVADVNVRETAQGKTLLMWAAQFNSNPEMIVVILKAGGDVTARDTGAPVKNAPAYGWTALMWAAASNKNPEVITTLAKGGSNVNEKDTDGLTPLMIAAENNGNASVVARVAGLSSDLNAKDNNGYTALIHAASKTHNPAVIIALLKAGADPKTKNNKGYAALDYAKANRDLNNTDAILQLQKASQ
jgi:ankyrin repeat protein